MSWPELSLAHPLVFTQIAPERVGLLRDLPPRPQASAWATRHAAERGRNAAHDAGPLSRHPHARGFDVAYDSGPPSRVDLGEVVPVPEGAHHLTIATITDFGSFVPPLSQPRS